MKRNDIKEPIFFLDHGMKGWVNKINDIIGKLPSGAVPDIICSFGKYGLVSGRKMLSKHKQSKYGLTLRMGYATIPKSDIIGDKKLMTELRNFSSLKDYEDDWNRLVEGKKDFNVYPFQVGKDKLSDFLLVSFNTNKFKTVDQLTASKIKVNEQYSQNNDGRNWHLNMSGELTIWHEFGHVFDNNRYISNSGEWSTIHSNWVREENTPQLIIQSKSEAFAEAFANVLGNGGKDVPPYVKDFVEKVTK